MIILDVMCGMGNQMFQYAYARALQEKYGGKLYLSTVTAKRMKDGREYALNNCRLNESVRVLPKTVQYIFDLYFKIKMKLMGQAYKSLEPKQKYQEMAKHGIYTTSKVFRYYEIPHSNKRIKYINGWWQSEKYFHDIAENIRQELKIVKPPTAQNECLMKEIASRESVCVHVRRGDYISEKFSSELDVCNECYYQNAFEIIEERISNPTFYIFSTSHEDILWIKEHWNFRGNVVYVDMNNADYEELRLMYTCKHFILANSTFSWWAAFLSQNIEKIVVAPKIWNKRDTEYEDVYMPEWIRI